MNSLRYKLEPYKGMNSRFHCPKCKHRDNTFTRYLDTETGQYIHSTVGRCNREDKCGYHYNPKQYFQDNNIAKFSHPVNKSNVVIPEPKPISFIPFDVFKKSLIGYAENNFVMYLVRLFGTDMTDKLISQYFIGTSKHWDGATVFWQIDIAGKIRTGKIMLYDDDTGKRIKEPFNHITWMHKDLKLQDFNLSQCFFGEHLLKNDSRPIAIVESEKTAIITSLYLPQYIWLACGGISNLTIEKYHVLKGRSVILYPDVQAWSKWNDKASELSLICDIKISTLLERKASEVDRLQGVDLADYLVKYNYNDFIHSEDIKANVCNYWSSYPEAKKYFQQTLGDRDAFHREYNKLYIPSTYDDFLRYTNSIN